MTAEGQLSIRGSDLEILFKVPSRDEWLILVGEHVGLEMNCPLGLSLPFIKGTPMCFNGIAHTTVS